MTWDQYWHGDCEMVKFYRKADRIRNMKKNHELWLQGMYIYEAIGDMAPVLRASFDGKSRKPIEYPTMPYPLDEAEAAERKRRGDAKKLAMAKAKFESMAAQFNAQIANKGVKT